MKIEKLEQRIAFDATPVYGPPIPPHLDYTPPPKLMPIGYVSEVELPAILPTPTATEQPYTRASLHGRDIYDEAFVALAEDGQVTLREARDWLVGMDDHTGYNRFEIAMATAEVNDPANLHLFDSKTFHLLTEVVNSPDFVYNDLDFIDVRDKTDELWFALRSHVDVEPELTLSETAALYNEDGITYAEMREMLTTATVDDNLDSFEISLFNHMLEHQDMPEYVYYFTDSVVNGHYANNDGDTPSILVDKWFNGADRPEARAGTTYREIDMPVFVNGVSSTDPIQGSLGDCYIITAMSAIAHSSPETIENMILEVDENLWVVRFYDNMEESHFVTVDNQLPTWSNGNSVYAKFNQELWPALIERAYVQATQNYYLNRGNLDNTYHQVAIGDSSKAAEHFLGAERIETKGESESAHIAYIEANIAIMNNYRGHTYHFESYNADTGVFFLRNPWGHSHIQGTWQQLEAMPIVGSAYGGYLIDVADARPAISNTRVINTHQSLVYGIYYDPSEFIFQEGRGSRLDRYAMEANKDFHNTIVIG